MAQKMVMIAKEEYDRLKKKAEIADDALILQLKLSLEDLSSGRLIKFTK